MSKTHMEQKVLRTTGAQDVAELEVKQKGQLIESLTSQLEVESSAHKETKGEHKETKGEVTTLRQEIVDAHKKSKSEVTTLRQELDDTVLQVQDLTEQLFEEQHRVQMHAEDNYELQSLLQEETDLKQSTLEELATVKQSSLEELATVQEQLQLYKANPEAAEMDEKLAQAEAKAQAPLLQDLEAKAAQLQEAESKLEEMQKRHGDELQKTRSDAEDAAAEAASAASTNDSEEKLMIANMATAAAQADVAAAQADAAAAQADAANAAEQFAQATKQLDNLRNEHASAAKHLDGLDAEKALEVIQAEQAATKQEESSAMAAKLMVDEANNQASYIVQEAEREKQEAIAQTVAVTATLQAANERVKELSTRLKEAEQQLGAAQEQCKALEQEAHRQQLALAAEWQQLLLETKQDAMAAIGAAIEEVEAKCADTVQGEARLRAASEQKCTASEQKCTEHMERAAGLENDVAALKQAEADRAAAAREELERSQRGAREELESHSKLKGDELRKAVEEAECRRLGHVEEHDRAMTATNENHRRVLESEIAARKAAEGRATTEAEAKAGREKRVDQLADQLRVLEGENSKLTAQAAQADRDRDRQAERERERDRERERSVAETTADAARKVSQAEAGAEAAKIDLAARLRAAETRVADAETRGQVVLQNQLMAEAKLSRGQAKLQRTEEELIHVQKELEEARSAYHDSLSSFLQPPEPLTLAELSANLDATNRGGELPPSSPARSRLDERRQRQQRRGVS